MRVLVISPTFPPMRSGGAPFAYRLCEKLGEQRVDVHVLTSQIHDVVTSRLFRLWPLMRHWSWSELPRLIRLVRRLRPDVVDLHFAGSIYSNEPMITMVPGVLRRVSPRLRVVTHFEYPGAIEMGRVGRGSRAVRRALATLLGPQKIDYHFGTILDASDRIVVLSEDYVGMLAKRHEDVGAKCVLIPPPPTVPISPAMDPTTLQRERTQLQITAQEFVVAYYGLLYPGKGLEVLVEAFHLLAQRNKRVRLLVIGGENEVMLRKLNRKNYTEDLIELARRLGVAGRVIWTGDCPFDSDRASRFLRVADACVLPFDDGVKLHRSSFAVVAAHGRAIVTTRGERTESAFVDGSNVLMFLPKDPRALADRLDSLIESPALRRRLEEGALELSREWFSWEKALERTMQVFAGEL